MSPDQEFDQFYTNPKVCDEIVKIIKDKIPNEFKKDILEPSAGSGNFINSLISTHEGRILAYDIDPKVQNVVKQDYLKAKIKYSNNRLVIGNPPFGNRGKLALEFLNKSLTESDYVCFILPNIFNRYSIQSKVLKDAKLLYSMQLNKNSFIFQNKEYDVKCVFQIWTTKPVVNNLRITQKPEIKHKDFQTFIHNNTKETLKYFNKKVYNWDFAVHRQGYYDYNVKITNPKDLVKNRQYFFIKVINPNAWDIISKIDFDKLSKTNTQTYGFSTSDFVKEYKYLKGE